MLPYKFPNMENLSLKHEMRTKPTGHLISW
jgi:hypothetical protein